MKLGLCCQFAQEPIRFRVTTATACARLARDAQLRKLSELCLLNAQALELAVEYCANHQIAAFRILSQFWPLKTHPKCGYRLEELPDYVAIANQLQRVRTLAQQRSVRLTFHPDQFVVLNSPRPEVVASSLAELEYQAEAAELVGADVINIHGGGEYGDKAAALARFRTNLQRLSSRARQFLTLENDDKIFTPADLLPVCDAERIPLCYDVHHHRCLPDELSIVAATMAAIRTWERADLPREPLFHLSSPLNGWGNSQPQLHHDEIDPTDVPAEWRQLPITVDIEAKGKELAIAKLQRSLRANTM